MFAALQVLRGSAKLLSRAPHSAISLSIRSCSSFSSNFVAKTPFAITSQSHFSLPRRNFLSLISFPLRTVSTSAKRLGYGASSRPSDLINERIRAKTVRLIDIEGKQVGVMDTASALRIARDQLLDLVQVGAGQDPVVCKLMDYKKHMYESATKMKEIKKAQRKTRGTMKIIRLKNHIDDHDLETKVRRAAELLDKGYFLKLQLMFKNFYEFADRVGEKKLDDFLALLSPDPKHITAGQRKPGFNSLSLIVKKNTKESLFTVDDLEVYSDDEEEEVDMTPEPKKEQKAEKPAKPTKPSKINKAPEVDDGLQDA